MASGSPRRRGWQERSLNGSNTDHYRVLGVPRRADHGQIRRAYLDAARRWHPDRQGSKDPVESERAELAMRRVNEAWEVLGNKDRRAAYDRQLLVRSPDVDRRPRVADAEGVIRVDPRLLDPEFLAARRQAQQEEISARTSVVLRVAPMLAVLGLLVAIFVFTAYARDRVDQPAPITVPGPRLGAGIEAFDCVRVIGGPALIEVPCSPTVERVIGARLPDGRCPLGTDRDVVLSNGAIVCLDVGS